MPASAGSSLVGVWVKPVLKGVADRSRAWAEGGEEEEVSFFSRVLTRSAMDWTAVRRAVWVWEMDWRASFRSSMFVDVEPIVKVVLRNVGREMELLQLRQSATNLEAEDGTGHKKTTKLWWRERDLRDQKR